MADRTWLVYRPGSPDPSRPSPAIHHDDPAKDRDVTGRLGAPIPIAPEYRGLPLAELVALPGYAPPEVA